MASSAMKIWRKLVALRYRYCLGKKAIIKHADSSHADTVDFFRRFIFQRFFDVQYRPKTVENRRRKSVEKQNVEVFLAFFNAFSTSKLPGESLPTYCSRIRHPLKCPCHWKYVSYCRLHHL